MFQGGLAIFAALAGACQMLAGAPEMILITWLIVAGIFLVQSWRKKKSLLTGIRCLGIIVLAISGPLVRLMTNAKNGSSGAVSRRPTDETSTSKPRFVQRVYGR